MGVNYEDLADALVKREREYTEAIDKLRDLAPVSAENDVYDLTRTLCEAIEIARCARRLLKGRTVAEVHAAFGAPGDFGYGTPIGDALARTYRGES